MPASHLTAKNRIKFHEGGDTWQHRELHPWVPSDAVGRRRLCGGPHVVAPITSIVFVSTDEQSIRRGGGGVL